MATSTGFCVCVEVPADLIADSTPEAAMEYSCTPALASYPTATRYVSVLSMPSADTLAGAVKGDPVSSVKAVVVPVAKPVIWPRPTSAVYTNFELGSTTVLRGTLPLG